MALESSVRECAAGLTSIRATERKKNGENLKNFLMGNAVPSLLTENSIQNKGYTWNDVFDDIHELVIKETEKYETSKNFDTVMGPLCANLLHLCVSRANRGRAYIRSDKIIESCLFILRDSRLTKAVGDSYLNLLYKQVFTCDYYLNNITPTAWEDLLDVCLTMCMSKHSKLDEYTRLRLLLLVIRYGSRNCQFVIPLRDSLTRMMKCFLAIFSDKKVQEVNIEIMILLMETLSVECRLTICEFTENLLSNVVKFYDQNLDHKKKESLFKVLQMCIAIHHPLGRYQKECGSLANNWELWNKHMLTILEIVCLEVNFVQKQRRQQEILSKHCHDFYDLAASVYFQVFNFSTKQDQEEGEHSAKRQKLTFNKNNSFSDLVEDLKLNNIPWLAIIHMFVKKYGQFIATDDYISLLSASDALVANNVILNWSVFEEMMCLVITNLKARSLTTNNEQDVLISLWNSCVRTSSLANAAHKPLHSVMQLLLTLDVLNYQNVQPLIKLYYERGMPVTNHSLNTMNSILHKFFSKCSYFDERLKCFTWLTQGQVTTLNVSSVKELLLRLLVTENVEIQNLDVNAALLDRHEILFNSIENSILLSEFEIDITEPQDTCKHELEHFDLNYELSKEIKQYFVTKLSEYIQKLNTNEVGLLEYIKFVHIILSYLDVMLKYNLTNETEIRTENLHSLLKTALQEMYASLNDKLSILHIPEQIMLLKSIENILTDDYGPFLSCEARRIPGELFKSINVIVNKKISIEEGIVYEEDDSVLDPHALRHVCMCVLAAYCRKRALGRNEILDFIMDPKIYNFTSSWDVNCALECIELLSNSKVEEPPLDSIFFLMQGMCKDLFKNSDATSKLLKVFIKMLIQFWNLDNGKQNCCIMVRGYMQRCEKKFYPPGVAALIYECAAKTAALNLKQDVENIYLETVLKKIKAETHSIRLYCVYLLNEVVAHIPAAEVSEYITSMSEMFVVNVTDRREAILKDELLNRTLTVLHTFLALVRIKNSLLHNIVTETIQMQKEKSLDKQLVKKVLKKIINIITKKSIEIYFNDSILLILNFWFTKGNNLNDLPLYLFGFDKLDFFVEKHLKWLIPADTLWRKRGVVKDSEVLKIAQDKSGKSRETIIEACISNIMALYLPYVVIDKYELNYKSSGRQECSVYAKNMFESTRQLLGADKWSALFVENMSELVVIITTHLRDNEAAKELYDVNIPPQSESYYYPKTVFDAILSYMGELIEENVLKYLCENQALTIFKALFQLWANVLDERVFEYKVVCLHTYVSFVESIPLGHSSDAFVWNFACNSLAHAIKDSRNEDEIKVFVKGLQIILNKFLPEKVDAVRNPVSRILSILMIKKEEGFETTCAPLLEYLTCDVKEYLKENEDVVDFISLLSQGSIGNLHCLSKLEFLEKMKTYKTSLSSPSIETLINIRQFMKVNKIFVNKLCDELNTKGFSDDCGTSIIHQVIYSLSNTLKSATDDKTIIEACNCLAEIGNYDLKTLVTVPPSNTQRITNIEPKQYFAILVMTTLADILFDENPIVTNAASKTLKYLMQYREGKVALDLEDDVKQILMPLASTDCNIYAVFKIDTSKFKLMCAADFWIKKSNENHSRWLTRITCAVLDVLISSNNYLSTLHAVCVLKPVICKKILSPLIGLLLDCSSESHVKILSGQINRFFKHVWDLKFDNRIENSEESHDRNTSNMIDHDLKNIIQYVLDVVNFVRLQKTHYNKRPDRSVENLNYLQLDYDKVAWVATLADQNVAAIYYGELWAAAQNKGVPPSSPEATTKLIGGENIQRIFRKCFVSIGEMDAIDGCGTAHLTSEDEKRKHLINTGQFADALLLHDIALSGEGNIDPYLQYGVVKSLHKSGMHHLALRYIKSLPENDNLNDIKYECMSFLGDWSEFVNTRELEEKSKQPNCNPYSIIKTFRYSCLKDCLNLQPTSDFENKLIMPLNRAKRAVSRLCQNLNMENCQNVYKIVSKLHLFGDIEDYFSVRCNKITIKAFIKQWQIENLPAFNDFKHLEALISQRSLILEHAAKTYQTSLKDITSLQLQYTDLCLSNERVQMAQRLMAVVKRVQTSAEVALADSQISWAKGHKDIALSLLRNIVSNPPPDVRLTAVSLRQYGTWMAESKCDNARDIINKYLKKSLEVLSSSDHEETRLKVYYDIAKFADAEYKQVVAYMNSSVFEKKLQCLEKMKGTALTLRSTQQVQVLSKDERKALNASDRFGKIDEAEIASTKAEKETFLHLAMRYYLLSLKQCEVNNLSVFRVISLWLDNQGIQLNESEGGSFEDLLHSIPSRKYITVLPQLAPRLTNEKNFFADNLRMILNRCAVEHPHHTLPILFSLKNSDKDKKILNASENASGVSQRSHSSEPRVIAAEAMVRQLAQEGTTLAPIIKQMDKLCDATISLANYVPKTKETRQKIPSAERLHRLGQLDAIPIPTVTIPIRADCDYSDLPTIFAFQNYFELVGGINCPKKINCQSSDGRSRILLIKGEDDLRQDAVMQQVFNIVNTLLEKDPVTSRNKLLIRTYKVVPMSRRSGVLEWCEGTMPIGLYLLGPSGAHTRYRPQDISAAAARAQMTNLHDKRRSNNEKLAVFIRIIREFRPVFHYFFTEHFLDPVTWYERRLAYTKSVASSSMVGYILGLGDRHLQNILIDKKTAEVVHIDFGIAFDQGRTLPTPETIPFRLTQDIVAGFGSSGVEGMFRRSCEKMMQLLRDNQETLLTILEVLLCDPLYTWTVISKQQNVLSAQSRDISINQSSGSDDSLAKRALLSVSSKLSGTEGGVAGGVAVPGQVARLIHTAMDPANLSRLFPGWQPYL